MKKEFAGYRYIGDEFCDIIAPHEKEAIEEALEESRFPGVRTHIQTAFSLYADRENPDYRNSIKESISAVASMAIIISGDDNASMSKALAIVEKKTPLHNQLKTAFSNLYNYTSDSDGIRHALLDEGTEIPPELARFFLIACSGFVNYLKIYTNQ